MNLNHENLKQFFKKKALQGDQSSKYMNSKTHQNNKNDNKGFSSSRYEYVEPEGEDYELMPYYDEQTKSYAVPESKIDLNNYKNRTSYDDDLSDQLYINAKNSLNRTKVRFY